MHSVFKTPERTQNEQSLFDCTAFLLRIWSKWKDTRAIFTYT